MSSAIPLQGPELEVFAQQSFAHMDQDLSRLRKLISEVTSRSMRDHVELAKIAQMAEDVFLLKNVTFQEKYASFLDARIEIS